MSFQRMIALFMDYCMSKQLRPKTMKSYEQALQLFARWLREEMEIDDVEDVKEPHILLSSPPSPTNSIFVPANVSAGDLPLKSFSINCCA